MNPKNESELGEIYVRSISFYRELLKITCKLCTPVCVEVREVYLMAPFFKN